MDISFFDSIQEYFGESQTEPGQYSSLALAYIGDGDEYCPGSVWLSPKYYKVSI